MMTKNSEQSFSLVKQYTPNGSQTLSKMPERYVNGVYPKLLERGKNGHVFDVEGCEYIDLISGLGAISVGYSNDDIDNAVYLQMRKGTIFSLPNELEGKAAKLLTELVPGTEMWKFGKNGTDGNLFAVRAARAYTGRNKILTVGYNGCADVFECRGTRTAGIPKSLKQDTHKAYYNNINSFHELNYGDVACVLMEPMVYDFPSKDFLGDVKLLCKKTGTLLVFDEVVNGGRWKDFVSSRYFEVQPDLYVLGKGLANGLPLCAVGGSRSIMSTFERDDFFASNTFGGECLSLAAFIKTQEILTRSIKKMIWNGDRIKEAFNKLDWPEHCEAKGYSTRLSFFFSSLSHKALFWQEMCLHGVLVGYSNFIMATHTDEDVTQVIDAIYKSYKVVKDNWKDPMKAMKGQLPVEALKKS